MIDVKPTVVLLHGLARTRRSLRSLRRAVEAAGYPTWSRSYPSIRMTTLEAAAWVRERLLAEVAPGPLFGVTHSLGGIVVRQLAAHFSWEGLVMLAPPNQGSRLARAVAEKGLKPLLCGPAGRELASEGLWPSPPSPFAVVAGTRPQVADSAHSWLGRRLGVFGADVPHDGTVCVDETRLPGMADFATVPAGHHFLMDDPRVEHLVLSFLRHGRFVAAGATRAEDRQTEPGSAASLGLREARA